MEDVGERPAEGQDPVPALLGMSLGEWVQRMRVAFEDADAAAEDMLRSPRKQSLGHVQHKRLYRGAAKQLRALLAAPPHAKVPLPEAPDSIETVPTPLPDRDLLPAEFNPLPEPLRGALRVSFEQRRLMAPADRARVKLLYYFQYALPWGARGRHAEEIDGLVRDLLDAAVIEMRTVLRADQVAAAVA